jgi:hypothetical protein
MVSSLSGLLDLRKDSRTEIPPMLFDSNSRQLLKKLREDYSCSIAKMVEIKLFLVHIGTNDAYVLCLYMLDLKRPLNRFPNRSEL